MLISLEDVIQFTLGKNTTRIDRGLQIFIRRIILKKIYIVSLHWIDQMNALLIL